MVKGGGHLLYRPLCIQGRMLLSTRKYVVCVLGRASFFYQVHEMDATLVLEPSSQLISSHLICLLIMPCHLISCQPCHVMTTATP